MESVEAALLKCPEQEAGISVENAECLLHVLPLATVGLPLLGLFMLYSHFFPEPGQTAQTGGAGAMFYRGTASLVMCAAVLLAGIPFFAFAEKLYRRVRRPRLLMRQHLLQRLSWENDAEGHGTSNGRQRKSTFTRGGLDVKR